MGAFVDILNFIGVSVLVVFICGCAGTYRSPDLVEGEEFSVVNVKSNWRQEPYIVRVDGKSRGFGTFDRYEVPPGVRAITASMSSRWQANLITKCFLARAGQSYLFVGEVDTNFLDTKGTWSFRINDKTGMDVSAPCSVRLSNEK